MPVLLLYKLENCIILPTSNVHHDLCSNEESFWMAQFHIPILDLIAPSTLVMAAMVSKVDPEHTSFNC